MVPGTLCEVTAAATARVVLPPPPPASSAAAARVLSRTRRRDTAPELALRRALFALGLRLLVDAPVPGCGRRRRVDVLLRGARIAVLVHGCFWHSCPAHFHPPKANAQWWRLKMASIRERDADTLLRLQAAGWLPVVVWEHEDAEVAAAHLQVLSRRRREELERLQLSRRARQHRPQLGPEQQVGRAGAAAAAGDSQHDGPPHPCRDERGDA